MPPPQPIPLHLTVQVTADYAYQLWSSSLYPFLQLNSSLLYPSFLSRLFSESTNPRSSPHATDHTSCLYKARDNYYFVHLHLYICRSYKAEDFQLRGGTMHPLNLTDSSCLRECSFDLLLQLFNTQLGHVRFMLLVLFKPNSFLHASEQESDQPTQPTLQSFLRS